MEVDADFTIARSGVGPVGVTGPTGPTGDHGELGGLADDDHPQYLPVDGTRAMSGPIDMTDNELSDVAFMDFNLVNGIASSEGRLVWNDIDGTLNLGMPGGSVNLQIGQEQLLRVKNDTASLIINGTPVRITGAQGTRPTIGLADADNPAAAGAFGLTTEDIDASSNGYVTTFGLVRDVKTDTFSVGDRLYVSNTPGVLTTTPPTGSERLIFMGIVVVSGEADGLILASPINVSYLSELSGNTITSPADLDLLQYDSASATWVNRAVIGETGPIGSYNPGDPTDWEDPDPTTISEALDRLAAAVRGGETGPVA
jgi:hypothetical protein